jgi:superfamily I DNA/RNA helicase
MTEVGPLLPRTTESVANLCQMQIRYSLPLTETRSSPWSGTFNSIDNRLLRRHATTLSVG